MENLEKFQENFQEQLEALVQNLNNSTEEGSWKTSLVNLKCLLQKAVSISSVSVVKGIQQLLPSLNHFKEIHRSTDDETTRSLCAEIISFASIGNNDPLQCLEYRLTTLNLGGDDNICEWGYDYVSDLTKGILQESTNDYDMENKNSDKILKLAQQIIAFYINQRREVDACDLAMEIGKLEYLEQSLDANSVEKVCSYLLACYENSPSKIANVSILRAVLKMYKAFGTHQCEAMAIAIKLRDVVEIRNIFTSDKNVENTSLMRQLAFMIARQHVSAPDDQPMATSAELTDILANRSVFSKFRHVARELLGKMVHTHPTELLSRVIPNLSGTKQPSSYLVHGLINAGLGGEQLFTGHDTSVPQEFLDSRMFIAAIGILHMWDPAGMSNIFDKLLPPTAVDNDCVTGAFLLAYGISNYGVTMHAEISPGLFVGNLLPSSSEVEKLGAMLGLGLAFAGTSHSDSLYICRELLTRNDSSPIKKIAALASSLIVTGTWNADLRNNLIQLMPNMNEPDSFYFSLAMGICCLGSPESSNDNFAQGEQFPPILANIFVEACAFACTGDQEVFQKLFQVISPSAVIEFGDNLSYQNHLVAATLGLAVVCMGNELATKMCHRILVQLMNCENVSIQKTVPLALALLYISNPEKEVLENLQIFSHSRNENVAINAIFALGIIGAGTINGRIVKTLQELAEYYVNNHTCQLIIQISIGLVYLGQGLMTLNPFTTNGLLWSPVALAGLLITAFLFIDTVGLVARNEIFLINFLITAIHPRILMTLDKNLNMVSVPILIGQATDTVGVAGDSKTITHFYESSTPIVLAHGERAQLASENYRSISPFLEGFVIVEEKL